MTVTFPVIALIWTGLLGLTIGSFLNVVIHRVPAGIPLTTASRCPRCEAPIRWWQNVPVLSWMALRGRCAACSAPIAARYPVVEAATAVVFVGVAWFLFSVRPDAFGPGAPAAMIAVAAAFLWFAGISIALAVIDLDTNRLPDAIVLPSYLVGGVLFTLACLLGAEWSRLLQAAIGMAALYLFYFLLRVARPGGMGGGDVKLAGVIGMHLGWLGWDVLIVGAFGAFVLGGVYGVALLVLRQAGRRTAIPFGPWMILGAWVAVVAGHPLAQWYLGLLPA